MKLQAVEDVAALKDWHAIDVAARAVDHLALPADPIEERLPRLDPNAPHGGEKALLRIGCDGGQPVVAVEISLPVHDNLGTASIDVRVRPELRSRGLGRAAMGAALEETAELGRPRVLVEAPSPYPTGPGPGDALLRSLGFKPALMEVRRLLDLREAVDVPLPRTPVGYRLVQWQQRLPADHLEDMAHLMQRMSTDAPLGELDWEPEVWDGARFRAKEDSALLRGRVGLGTLAVHEQTGRVVGFTDLGVNQHDPEFGYQWETIVEPMHRGHGLGLLLKAHNHRQLRERLPGTVWLNTWNAESNSHMVRINEQLGYRPVEYWTEWQLDR